MKSTVAPSLFCAETPPPVSLMEPESVTVPPLRFCMSTERPAVLVIAPPKVTLPFPPESLKSAPMGPFTLRFGPTSALLTFEPAMPSPLAVPTLTRRIVEALASWMPSPAALVIVGLEPPAATSCCGPEALLTLNPSGSPISRWLPSSGSPPVYDGVAL